MNPFASIRARILVGCLALTTLAGILGGQAQWAERELGGLALRIYDQSFMGMSYLRSAQVGFALLAGKADPSGVPLSTESVAAVLDDLAVAEARAMSPAGAAAARTLADSVSSMPATPSLQAFAAVQAGFERTVETFAGDGFRYRRSVGDLVSQQLARSGATLAVTLLAAIGITVALGRLIVPPVRRAVQVAQAIAAGRLDNDVPEAGRGEMGDLLRALAVMQRSIAAALARIRALMAEQEATHAGVMAAQHARMEAALANMNQGLCLFGADGRLAVANRRFAAMFGEPALGGAVDAVMQAAGLAPLSAGMQAGAVAELSFEPADGRAIAVSQRMVDGGGWVATFEDVSERRAAEARLAHAARHDALTGLPNRLSLTERMHKTEGQVALLCIGLDRFRAVNESQGNAAGDAALCAVADRLRARAGPADLVVRLGGDEFVIVQAGAPQPASAAVLGRSVQEAIAATLLIGSQAIVLGASVGIAVSGDELVGVAAGNEALLSCGQLAMHRAKSEGCGHARFFAAEMDAAAQRRRSLETDLRRALAEAQLELFYQPLLQDRGISGFEALLRWRHPERGMVSPAEFIPIAEETGLIAPIGAWVMKQACLDAARWPGALKVAVNLSPMQFGRSAVAAEAAKALAESGLPASRLELEITESVLLNDDTATAATLRDLQGQGIRIVMDDFGTGFSSLSYLLRFRFDKIKIDQSFVRGVTGQEDCRAIVRAVIGLGRALGINVNAEGVETQAQADLLRAEGCWELQGYLYSPPRPAADVAGLLCRHGNATLAREREAA